MGIEPTINVVVVVRRLINTTTEEDEYSDSINSKIISEELSISWRLKKTNGRKCYVRCV
jgi:hypothetical protein